MEHVVDVTFLAYITLGWTYFQLTNLLGYFGKAYIKAVETLLYSSTGSHNFFFSRKNFLEYWFSENVIKKN